MQSRLEGNEWTDIEKISLERGFAIMGILTIGVIGIRTWNTLRLTTNYNLMQPFKRHWQAINKIGLVILLLAIVYSTLKFSMGCPHHTKYANMNIFRMQFST